MESRIGETYIKRLLVFYIPLFMFLVAMLFPFYWMLITSLKPDPELYNVRNAPFIVRHPTVEHWVYLFKETLFGRWAFNTFLIATATTALSLFCGVSAAYSLSRLRFFGSTTIGVSIFITYLVPPTLLFIPLTSVVAKLGLLAAGGGGRPEAEAFRSQPPAAVEFSSDDDPLLRAGLAQLLPKSRSHHGS